METSTHPAAAPPIAVPVGCALFPRDVRRVPRSWAERVYTNIQRWSLMSAGGHFPGLEQPGLLTAELREFFRTAR
jgi:microsomal epoxide hydrolase